MNQQQAKKHILETWNASTGKRISEMMQRYWKLDKQEKVDKLVAEAKQIFSK